MVKIDKYPVVVGRDRGCKKTKNIKPLKPSCRRGRLTKSASFHRSLVREIVGYAPFERRIIELLKNDKEKRALKFTKKRIGGHRRAKAKRDKMIKIVRDMRSK